VIAESQKLVYNPESAVQIADEQIAARVIRLCEALEDNDDVQNVHANFELVEKVLERASG
jgi:transcriptional/translational regulatory protein YebC/TACO1